MIDIRCSGGFQPEQKHIILLCELKKSQTYVILCHIIPHSIPSILESSQNIYYYTS